MKNLIILTNILFISIFTNAQQQVPGTVQDWSAHRSIINTNFTNIYNRADSIIDSTKILFVGANYVGSFHIGYAKRPIYYKNVGLDAGDFNTYIGCYSGKSNTIAKKNTGIGYGALQNDTSGWANTAVGYLAGTTGKGLFTIDGVSGNQFYANTFVGSTSGRNTTTGSYNSFFGVNSGLYNTTGSWNTFAGVHAGDSNSTGNYNVFIGWHAGYRNRGGNGSVFIGSTSGEASYADYVTGIGNNAFNKNTTGVGGVAIGKDAGLNNTTGTNNTFIGRASGYTNSTGGNNTCIGYGSNYYGNGGAENTTIGNQSNYGTSSANKYWNTIIGYQAGYINQASGNTFIGHKAGDANTSGAYNIVIGYGADASSATGSYQISIGNTIRGNTSTYSVQIYNTSIDSVLILKPSSVLSITTSGLTSSSIKYATIKIAGSGGAVDITANPQIVDGQSGQVIIIQGTSDVNTVTFDDGTGIELNANAQCVLGKGDKLALQYDSTDDVWYELYRSNN